MNKRGPQNGEEANCVMKTPPLGRTPEATGFSEKLEHYESMSEEHLRCYRVIFFT